MSVVYGKLTLVLALDPQHLEKVRLVKRFKRALKTRISMEILHGSARDVRF